MQQREDGGDDRVAMLSILWLAYPKIAPLSTQIECSFKLWKSGMTDHQWRFRDGKVEFLRKRRDFFYSIARVTALFLKFYETCHLSFFAFFAWKKNEQSCAPGGSGGRNRTLVEVCDSKMLTERISKFKITLFDWIWMLAHRLIFTVKIEEEKDGRTVIIRYKKGMGRGRKKADKCLTKDER